nr:hypothetical protein [Halomicrobium salinisoli]
MTTPIEDRVQELTGRYYRGLEVLQAINGATTVDELAADLEIDVDAIRERIAYLEAFDRVLRNGETVRLTE